MTKKDVKAIVVGGGLGLGALLAIWWLARKTNTIPVISPVAVNWEPHS